ncbi:MAG: monofunctional biosynthetic peptidoglycan transglycosylase [Deltaproteobacteria bacterium]|nr:monofunctional biosynthetic peptidoglycan transglycosylase [Deltaproteobacteria bacterium]
MKRMFRRFLLGLLLLGSLLLAFAGYEYSRLPDVTALRRKNPKTTALMELRDAESRKKGVGLRRQQIWVPYSAVSEHLRRAILLSEDASFFSHKGIDFYELRESVKEDWQAGRLKRGGSTITMQLARNLYLDPSKNIERKLREVAIAWKLEQALSKQRIFELYLNVVEWGPGIYGAEAAARHYFFKPATSLDPIEAATLVALLPNPLNPREKSLLYRRNLVLTRMARTGHISDEAYMEAMKVPLFQRRDEVSDVSH